MIAFEKRLDLLDNLGQYLLANSEDLQQAKNKAVNTNAWFTLGNIDMAIEQIATCFLQKNLLKEWARKYPPIVAQQKVGIVMAGNIPLVGFHDFLCGFIIGHQLFLKLSSKDDVLLKHFLLKLIEWEPSVADAVIIAEQLKNCDAYIATGSNNSSRYFEQYFGKYPHIIRKNRTSVALLEGNETAADLCLLAKDVFSYFGLGCRNVTQIVVPRGYDFTQLLQSFTLYEDVINHNKYKNNFDYFLAIYLLNRVPYLSNNSVLLVENEVPFSAVSVLHYQYYDQKDDVITALKNRNDIQTIVGKGFTPFGNAQIPSLYDYADGVDTMAFLSSI